MNVPALIEFFRDREGRAEPMVLATVFETQGSTYSKAGAHMLVDGNGDFQGMLSGGCLEGDLAARAADVIESGTPQLVNYDLAQDDELWGLGVGCDGLMRVFLQAITHESGYEPFATIAEQLQGDDSVRLTVVIESELGDIGPGAAVIDAGEGRQVFGMTDDMAAQLMQQETEGLADVCLGAGTAMVFVAVLSPPPRILVLGAGMDAEPVVRFACELGWRCTVVDHRDAYIDRGNFPGAEDLRCQPAESLADAIDIARFDAAIVMSHHLASDRSYLRQLAQTDIGYIGLLGPAGRRDRLLGELVASGDGLASRLRGPAGLDLGGRGPAAIALSIIAEIQGVLQGKTC